MAESFVRVYLAAGDEQQLTSIDPDDFVQLAESINGQPIDVRFFNAEPDQDDESLSDTVQRLTDEQGWTDDTVGSLALTFLRDVTDEDTRQRFLLFLHQTQQTENGT